MLAGRASRRGVQVEEGRASVNNESIDSPADDGSGCYDDRGSVTQSVEKMLGFFCTRNIQSRLQADLRHFKRFFV